MKFFWCYMIWCGDIGSDVGSAFHVKMKTSLIAIDLVSDNGTREK